MEPAAFLLLIIGCSDDLNRCIELPAPAPAYADAETCESVLPSEMRSYAGQFPQILAKCVRFDAALEEGDAELVWHIEDNGDLIASVRPLPHEDLEVVQNGKPL
ncbi:hypothetical protein [Chelativorans sp. AA-79]|uniref:hypothetical protein n=1 Tax=Chelativorans sp. AA-79 TaxID=3028735 RepID=UPI0023F71CCD|nr:hypothetical protein [Chelativorans sp. AA-79]WEX10035.1 hypothetical protein PVE73_03450 [Chelativorans sp. AA-79]